MSPEQINEVCYDEKSDIWSCGCLLYELAALKPPFEASNHLSLAIKIKAGKFDRIPLRYSEDLFTLIRQMLSIGIFFFLNLIFFRNQLSSSSDWFDEFTAGGT